MPPRGQAGVDGAGRMTGPRTPSTARRPLRDSPEAYPLAGAGAQAQRRATPARSPSGTEAGPPAGASAGAMARTTPPRALETPRRGGLGSPSAPAPRRESALGARGQAPLGV